MSSENKRGLHRDLLKITSKPHQKPRRSNGGGVGRVLPKEYFKPEKDLVMHFDTKDGETVLGKARRAKHELTLNY